jgi:hypothetical protein
LQQKLVGYGAQQGENANLFGHSCSCMVTAPALCTNQNELPLDALNLLNYPQYPGALTSHHGFYTLHTPEWPTRRLVKCNGCCSSPLVQAVWLHFNGGQTMTIAMAAMVATVWKGHQNTETETTAHICPYQIYQTEQAIPCPSLYCCSLHHLLWLSFSQELGPLFSGRLRFCSLIYLCCHTGHPAMTWMKKAHLATKAIVSVPNLTQSTVTQPQPHKHIYTAAQAIECSIIFLASHSFQPLPGGARLEGLAWLLSLRH